MYLCDLSNEAHIDKRVAETIGLKPSEKHVFCLAKRLCLEGMNWRVIETHTPMPPGALENHILTNMLICHVYILTIINTNPLDGVDSSRVIFTVFHKLYAVLMIYPLY